MGHGSYPLIVCSNEGDGEIGGGGKDGGGVGGGGGKLGGGDGGSDGKGRKITPLNNTPQTYIICILTIKKISMMRTVFLWSKNVNQLVFRCWISLITSS